MSNAQELAASAQESVATGDAAALAAEVRRQVSRRRTFAIISHPDAGKTTLTEKLLLYSGCVAEAGAVRGRKTQRAATSDWMAIERERGISITSTVLSFEYGGLQLNLLDTPGHEDFSEDTYRTLTAADCAVMVIDAVKGIETQTKKLFKICAERHIPILTFVNKVDRPGCDPLKNLSEIEEVLGIHAIPLNWPIGTGRDFRGVFDRQSRQALIFESVIGGAIRVPTQVRALDAVGDLLEEDAAQKLRDEVDLLDCAGEAFDRDHFLAGEMTPVFFGSALNNFGVEPFLQGFLELAPPPAARESDIGVIPTDRPEFAGVIFKIQANLDPRHHDRVAFLRVCAGRFLRDMEITHARTGEKIRIKRSQKLFARERETMEVAYAGDVIGLVIPGQFRLGDTLCDGPRIQFKGQWNFSPECFGVLRCADTLRRKQFDRGIHQLVEEGAIQMLHEPAAMSREPVLAAVGQLQFEVVQYRLEAEYNAKTTLQRLPYQFARWVTGDPVDLEAIRVPSSCRELQDQDGTKVVLFDTPGMLRYCLEMNPKLTFSETRPKQ
jgi:peptide chain release factor 3